MTSVIEPNPDHDLLIRIDARMEAFISEVRATNQQFTMTDADHESRIRILEAASDQLKGTIRGLRWVVGGLTFLFGVIEPAVLFILGGKK